MSQPQESQSTESRRGFLQAGGVVAAGAVAVNSLPISRAAHTFSSDEIKIGLVGCGGRGTGAALQALDTASDSNRLKLTAVADPFKFRIDGSLNSIQKKHAALVDLKDKTFVGVDAFKKLLESDVDMVILATPPGFRPMHFEAAIKAGKHVFMEKPVAVDAPGVRRVLEANKMAKEKKLAVAVGLQRRHESGYQATIQKLRDGAIGDIILTRAYWNMGDLWVRNREPQQSELEYQINNWYHFNWLSGDHICEQHIHNLDVINWLMDGYPVEAQGQGGRQVRTGKQYGQIYDHHSVEFTYANGTKLLSQCRQISGCWNEVKEYAHGSKGWCEINAGKIYDRDNKVIWTAPANEQGHAKEHVDLFASIRKGEIPNEGDYGAYSTMTSIMGRMATYTGKKLSWKDCLNSKVSLANTDAMDDFSDEAPLKPDDDGRYWVPQPGQDPELVV
jgi:myo-inositol 2-dehydrogenase/D-chiro-inositol 1-dehydrogenase